MKRHRDALGIQQGARNVRAIARSLMEASEEAAREGIGVEQDAAVRMIVHQLAKVCKVDEIKYGFDPASLRDVYCTLMAECEERANEISVQPERAKGGSDRRELGSLGQVQAREIRGSDTVAVVLSPGGAREAGRADEGVGKLFRDESEPRRGFLSRFLGWE